MGIFNRVAADEHDRVKAQRDKAITDLAGEVERREAAERENARMRREMVAAAKEIEAKDAEIARLKPLAEATERRRANDAKRVRPSRAKKGEAKPAPKAKPAAKAAGKGRG